MRTETTPSTSAPQVYLEADHEAKARSYPHDPTALPKVTIGNSLPRYEILENDGVINDQQQVAIELPRPQSLLVSRPSSIIRRGSDGVHSERSPPPSLGAESPRSAEKFYPLFNSSETVQDAVRRVVQALSEVLADSELEYFFDNLTDTELDELLVNDVKVKEACNDALAKHTGELVRVKVGVFWGLRPTRLIEIVRETSSSIFAYSPALQRGALERRARCLYCPTPQAASVGSDQSAKPLTNSSPETSPASQNSDSTETVAVIQISDEDTEMQRDPEELELIDGPYNPKDLLEMSKIEGTSCPACVTIPSFDYNVSVYASRLWSEVNSQSDRLKALDELGVLAGFFFAARSYADAFDLYYIIWTESGPSPTDKLAPALNCARSAATLLQDLCVEAILHHHLRAYTRDALSLISPLDRLQETIIHSFLGDLYEKLEKKTNAEAHDGKAILHLDKHKVNIIEMFFPQHSQILAALESQIAKRQIHVSQAIGYIASTLCTDDIHKRLATKLQNGAILTGILAGCAVTINENSHGLNSFRSILPKHPTEQDGCIYRTLLCYLIEKWLNDRERPSTWTVLRDLDEFGSPTEALSAIAMLIVHDCPYKSKLQSTLGKQRSSGTLSSALLKNIKELTKLNYRSFSEVYVALLAPSGEVRKQSLDNKSRTMMRQFMMNITSTGLDHRQVSLRGIGSQSSLVPSPDVFQEFEIRPASLSNLLYSPRSSFSSGLNSMRATATKTLVSSVLSFAKRRSVASVDDMSVVSSRSSWSFGVVTGMPRAPPGQPDWEKMDHEAGTIQEEPQDEEMVDV